MTAQSRSTGAPSSASSDREILTTRVFDAPRGLVFKAWTDPEQIARWWGPVGFTTTTHHMDVRPGGVWRFVMHGPDGVDYQNRIDYIEVTEPERLVYKHSGAGDTEPVNFHVTVTFDEQGERTKVTMRAVFPTAEARDEVAEKYGAIEGAKQTLGRLSEHLAAMAGGDRAASASPTLAGRKVVLTRTFDAPRSLVFEAWADPKHLKRWWGPHHFTNPVCEVDVRPGGAIRIDMAGPDGAVYPMKGSFREVVEPERLVFTSNAHEDEAGHPAFEVLTTATFAEHGGKTTLTVEAVVVWAKPEAAGAIGGMEAGWSQTLERLGAILEGSGAGESADSEFIVIRTFDAPRELVFKAWTEPDRLASWFGPKGFAMLSSTLDLKPGGVYHYGMKSPDGQVMWGRWVFREIVAPERLTFVASFSDEAGGVTRHPFATDWPLEVLSTLTLTEHLGRTTLAMRGIPIDATESERAAFEGGRESMQKGWKGTLDQLDEYLAKA
jgi:uncharacterized protein YndB with AHSA1/START domain